MSSVSDYVDRYLDPVIDVLTPSQAKKILEIHPDAQLSARVEYLASRANEGTLTDEERDEYKNLVDLGDIIALLKVKARRSLNTQAE